MNTNDRIAELSKEAKFVEYVRQFVNNPYFWVLKDAFVAYGPGGEAGQEKDALIAHGKNLGTRFPFNTMEQIAKPTPRKEQRGDQGKGKPDPDLDTDT